MPTSVLASLVRVNACHFSDRYSGNEDVDLIGEGRFGCVYRCLDKLAKTSRAVKSIVLPEEVEQQSALKFEVDALVALDHPHIARLIEYFVEDTRMLLVLELLEGPSLGDRMQEFGKFSEKSAARCARHMLKALFFCHCQGIAHNDVTPDNFRFQHKDIARNHLKMVDFGLSERFSKNAGLAPHSRGLFVQERDIWSAGVILYEILSGQPLFDSVTGKDQLVSATDPSHVPLRLAQLDVSTQAQDLLRGMLELATARRLSARDVLLHPFIEDHANEDMSTFQNSRQEYTLSQWIESLQKFHEAPRLKRVALLTVAHLVSSTSKFVASVSDLFRYLISLSLDAQRLEERMIRGEMATRQMNISGTFAEWFCTADVTQQGGLDYLEFLAVALISEPRLFCQESMLKALFTFFDINNTGTISDGVVKSLIKLPVCEAAGIVQEACGSDSASFGDLRNLMVPVGPLGRGITPASWADAPDMPCTRGNENTPLKRRSMESSKVTNLVLSRASDVFSICQQPGFHTSVMAPFYNAQPVSNVVMGIVRGTSSYAYDCTLLGLTEIFKVGDDMDGAFFIMPNPKYHWDPTKIQLQKSRFVAWWIAPVFLEELRTWFEGANKNARGSQPAATDNIGAPGDFSFSQIQKPSEYLSTYRDLVGPNHVAMLQGLVSNLGSFLERLLGDTLLSTPVSAGFHYPVRPQYSTLHLQLRVNSGSVCNSKECRGVDLLQLLARMREDNQSLHKDSETLYYQATVNLRNTVEAAAYSTACAVIEEVGPSSLVLQTT